MKLSTTTSSILCATMALSPSLPSLAAAMPTGSMEAPNSPNPASSPSMHQHPSNSMFDSEHSPLMNRSPALRTGHGSPRRSNPSRLMKLHRRASGEVTAQAASTSDTNPLNGVMDSLSPLFKTLRPISSTIEKPIDPLAAQVFNVVDGLPLPGIPLKEIAQGLGITGAQINARSSTPLQPTEEHSSASSDKTDSEPESSTTKSPDGNSSSYSTPEASEDSYGGSESKSPSYVGLGAQAEIIGAIPGALVIEFPSGEVDTVAYGKTGDSDAGKDGSTVSEPDSPAPQAPPSSPASPDQKGGDLDPVALLAAHPTSSVSTSTLLPTPSPVSSTIRHALAAVFSSLPSSSTFSHPAAPSQPASQLPGHSSTAALPPSGHPPTNEDITAIGPSDELATFPPAAALDGKPQSSSSHAPAAVAHPEAPVSAPSVTGDHTDQSAPTAKPSAPIS